MSTMNELGNRSNTSTESVSSSVTPLPVSPCINTNSQQGAGQEAVKTRDVSGQAQKHGSWSNSRCAAASLGFVHHSELDKHFGSQRSSRNLIHIQCTPWGRPLKTSPILISVGKSNHLSLGPGTHCGFFHFPSSKADSPFL